MMSFLLRRVAAIVFVACFAAVPVASCRSVPAEPKPALWRLADADSEVYLFGTVHLLPEGFRWRSKAVDAAFARAEVIYFETPTDETAGAEIARLALVRGTNPPGVRLSDGLSQAEGARLARVARTLGVPMSALEGRRPWFAALQLSLTMLERQGAASEGVEEIFGAEAARAAKQQRYLETAAQQIGFLADLSPEAEKAFLLATLRQIEEEPDASMALDDLWAAGDVDRLGRELLRMIEEAGPEVAAALLWKRNQHWAEEIDRVMQGKGVVFVAVGAAHLVGPQGLPALLRARGYAVEGPR